MEFNLKVNQNLDGAHWLDFLCVSIPFLFESQTKLVWSCLKTGLELPGQISFAFLLEFYLKIIQNWSGAAWPDFLCVSIGILFENHSKLVWSCLARFPLRFCWNSVWKWLKTGLELPGSISLAFLLEFYLKIIQNWSGPQWLDFLCVSIRTLFKNNSKLVWSCLARFPLRFY